MLLDDYILSHIDPESDYLHALYRDTHLRLLYPPTATRTSACSIRVWPPATCKGGCSRCWCR